MSTGKSYFMMFSVTDGGMVESISMNKTNLSPEKSIIIMDEEHLRVWLWHGKRRALVPRRMAMRQAESLKGHGYQAGNTIVGRGIQEIVEIDDRKVGQVPDDTKNSQELMALLDHSFNEIGNNVYIIEEKGKSEHENVKKSPSISESTPKPESVPKKDSPSLKAPVVSLSSKKEPQVRQSSSVSTSKPATAPVSTQRPATTSISAQKPATTQVSTTKPSTIQKDNQLVEIVKQGCLIMAINLYFKDLWVSKKADGSMTVEQMDGKICSFTVQNGEINFLSGSFAEIDPSMKEKIIGNFKNYCTIL